MAYIYILRCENDELYVGSTIDINDRLKMKDCYYSPRLLERGRG